MSYSQNNEEAYILSYFGSRTGTLLDIGANDGKTLSNSLACIERGWSAVLVDASPTAFAKLETLHAERIATGQVEAYPLAISDHTGSITLHESGNHLGSEDTALLSSLIEEETQKWKDAGTTYTQTPVYCIDVPTLLSRTHFEAFDFVSIDAEGSDLIILQQMDLTAMQTAMVIVEVNQGSELPFIQHCRKHGLRKRWRTPENLLFVR